MSQGFEFGTTFDDFVGGSDVVAGVGRSWMKGGCNGGVDGGMSVVDGGMSGECL